MRKGGETMKKISVLLIVCIFMLVGITTCVQAQTKSAAVTAKGKVVSIDEKAKTFTLQQYNGVKLTLGATIKQLDKIKVNDPVVVTMRTTKKGVLEAWSIRPPAPLGK